ncbi:Transposon protein [Arachis hypogaea]|nr:Transposon protein [Arachis hypogaea]
MGSNLSGSPLLGKDEKHTKEREHAFIFNKFITRNSSLIQFVKQYDNCLRSREQAERESDAADFYTVIPCATKSSIEAQFQDVYTHQKFREVQAQFSGKANCITRLTNSALGYSVYEVGEQVSSSIFNKFVVTYDSVAAEPSVIKIYIGTMEQEGKEATHTHQEQSRRAIVGAKKQEGTSSLSHEDANLESVNELQSPPRIRTRGRPKNRLGSKLDKQIANASKKKKTKALNELNLFDAASVVRSNSSQYQGRVMNYQFREPAAADNFLGV